MTIAQAEVFAFVNVELVGLCVFLSKRLVNIPLR